RAWAYEGKIYVESDRPATVYVFTSMGHLYRRETVHAGLTTFDAPQAGVYFIKFDNGYSGKILVE
ncbi:T9SS type A sorting domain-containing protein, partial [Tannerella forsythia]